MLKEGNNNFPQGPSFSESKRDNLFGNFSPLLTKEQEVNLNNLYKEIDSVLVEKNEDCTLCVIDPSRSHSGETQAIHGLIGLSYKLLNSKEISPTVRETVLTHELVHASLGSKLRLEIASNFPEIYEFHNKKIIGEWIKNNTKIPSFSNYDIEEKQKTLSGSPYNAIDYNKTREVLFDGLLQLEKGLTIPPAGIKDKIMITNLKMFKNFNIESVKKKETLPFSQLIENNPILKDHTEFLFLIAEKLYYNYRESVSRRIGVDLWEYEEGYAIAISHRITGASIDEVQKYAPQDISKIELAKKFMEVIKNSDEAHSCIQDITDYDSFGKFVKEKIIN